MEKHLRNLNFEEKIPTNFTEKNRQDILKKIKRIEKKSYRKPYFVPAFLSVAVVALLLFFGINLITNSLYTPNKNAGSTTKDSIKHATGKEQTVNSKMTQKETHEKLKVGVTVHRGENPVFNKDYSNSNYNLFVAHLRAAIITGNGIYTGIKPMKKEVYQKYLKSILIYLDNVEPNGEKEDKLQEAIQLTNKAINNNVKMGDPILDKINTTLRELDEYFNANPFVEGKTTEVGVELQ